MAACLPDIIQKGKTDMQKDISNGKGLEAIIRKSGKVAKELGTLPGSFSETLKMLMKKRGISRTRLSIELNVAEATISRIRKNDEYIVTKQLVIAMCIVLGLTPAEAFSFFDKSCCKLMMTNAQDIAYYHVLATCGQYELDEVNEMLAANGYEILGGK